MARHGMRKGLKKPKSSLPPAASASTSKLTTSGGSTKKTTTAGKAHPKSSKGKGKAPAPAPVVAPPINYDVIEALERPAKLVQLDRQLKITKNSTASLGKYDNKLKGEPTREKGKKRKFESNEIADSGAERERYLQVLGRLDEDEHKKRRKAGAVLERTNELVNVRKAIRGASRGRGTANLAGTEKKGKSFAGGSSGSKSGQSGGKTRSSASAKKGK